MSLIVNRRDLNFYLYEALDLTKILEKPRYQEFDQESINAILDLSQTLAENEYLSCAAILDSNEPKFINGSAVTAPETKVAFNAFREAGLSATNYDQEHGGMQLPLMVHQAAIGMLMCANTAVTSYQFLTQGVANLLITCGSPDLKDRYLAKLVSNEWCGTMCLSEPQAGSSLSDIRTKAERLDNGTYKISGTKMWISGGDHDLTDNIVHMVLAKVPGAPAGSKGISLFLVPKIRVNEDGSLGENNHVTLAGLNHKMGHRGTTNCILNFSEDGDSIGYLVGTENKGLSNMFHMMNEARVAVGAGATMSGLAGYLYSLDYARQRPQGRALGSKNPEEPMIMISEHPDVKRMLMTQKAFVEGAQMLIFYCAQLIDIKKTSDNQDERQRTSLLLDLLTPICKSWPSEFCLEANKLAIQVLGGYGYTREYPVERFYRDNRLNHIHEGTWAIHGLDILGRKVYMEGGAALNFWIDEVHATVKEASDIANFKADAQQLNEAVQAVKTTTDAVLTAPNFEQGLANATIFLDAMGHIVIAWLWLKQAIAAEQGLKQGNDVDLSFYEGKIAAQRFFFRYELPKAVLNLKLVASLDDTCLNLKAEQFTGV